MSIIKYRPEIDGLRAVAVIPVVLFHLGATWIPGGFVGVDVFFVISGFLITSIILKEQTAGIFTFSGFWMRRIRRILPAMLTMLIGTSVAGYFILFGPSWEGLGEQVFSAIFLYANVEMWQLSGNYWGPAAETAPLLHTWSLSVEEQFYLFYPLLLLILLKLTPKRVFTLILTGSVLSFGLGVYATSHSPNAAFYFLPPRAWELAAGCLLAIFERSRGPAPKGNISRTLASAGLLLTGAGYYLIQGAGGFPGFWALLPVVGTVLVIRFSGGEKCLASRLLSWAPVVHVGKCSYSLYLWHWPVIVMGAALQLKYPEHINNSVVIALIIILSLASYHFIEKPTRRAKNILMPVVLALVVSLGLAGFLTRASYNYNTPRFLPTIWMGEKYNVSPKIIALPASRTLGVNWHSRPESLKDAYQNNGVLDLMNGEKTPRVVFLGSSHGLMWAPVVRNICKELNVSSSFFLADGTNPLIKFPLETKPLGGFNAIERRQFDQNRLEKLRLWEPEVVIISARWERFDIFEFEQFILMLRDFGSMVLFIEQPPVLDITDVSLPLYLSYRFDSIEVPDEILLPQLSDAEREGRKRLRLFSEKYDFCRSVPIADLYEKSSKVVACRQNRILYIDDDHLSLAGSKMAEERISKYVNAALISKKEFIHVSE